MASIGIAIPTILPSRKWPLAELLCQLSVQCPGAPIAVSPHVDGQPMALDCGYALAKGAAFGADWTLYVEDDAFLASVFGEVLDATITEADRVSYRVVSFYSDNRRVLQAMEERRTTCTLPARFLWGTVCIALRTADVESIVEFAPTWYASHPQHWHAADLMLGAYFVAQESDVLVAVPSPVQHRDLPSTLGHALSRRRYSRSFRKAYGAVPQKLDQA